MTGVSIEHQMLGWIFTTDQSSNNTNHSQKKKKKIVGSKYLNEQYSRYVDVNFIYETNV